MEGSPTPSGTKIGKQVSLVSVKAGHWKNKMSKTHPGWNDIMTRASKVPGSTIEW